jgi:UDPglucose--hexose-1-phosphate uridylyltransferase
MRTLLDLNSAERASLAESISIIRRKYDALYGFVLPLMMSVRQAPLQHPDAPYHLYVQFLPLQRSATKLKYLASIETAYGTFLADTAPEEMAENLRGCEPRTNPYPGT